MNCGLATIIFLDYGLSPQLSDSPRINENCRSDSEFLFNKMDKATARYFEKIRFKEIPIKETIIEETDEENNQEKHGLQAEPRPSAAKKNWTSAIQKVKTQNIIKSGKISI